MPNDALQRTVPDKVHGIRGNAQVAEVAVPLVPSRHIAGIWRVATNGHFLARAASIPPVTGNSRSHISLIPFKIKSPIRPVHPDFWVRESACINGSF
jgi:hypothetical protein